MRRAAFTMTEILIVIALVVLIIALAVPAFNLITGTRSVDAAENLLSAMLSRARAEAITTNRVAGVAIFRDRDTERTALAIVVPNAIMSADFQYLPAGVGAQTINDPDPDPANPMPAAGRDRYLRNGVILFGADGQLLHQKHTIERPTNTTDVAVEPAGLEQYKSWKEFQEDGTTRTTYRVGDIVIALTPVIGQTNPAKRGTQVYMCGEGHQAQYGSNDPPRSPFWISLGQAKIFLFDEMGFGDRPGALATTPVGAASAYPLFSQLGIVLYDEETFKTAGGGQDDPLNDNVVYTPNETAEEKWLDENCLSLMVNRYNGTLVRGE